MVSVAFGDSSNGRTTVSDTVSRGSNPLSPATLNQPTSVGFFMRYRKGHGIEGEKLYQVRSNCRMQLRMASLRATPQGRVGFIR